MIDESALTGEPIPVTRQEGEAARSGTFNAGETFELTGRRHAGESTYAGIVRMVTAAQTAKAPFIRLADRFALLLLPVRSDRCRRRLVVLGRSHPGARGLGCGHAVSADPGRAGRLHRRRLAGGAAGHPHQGRRAARGAGAYAHRHVRQDGTLTVGGARLVADRNGARRERGRGFAAWRVAGAGLSPCRGCAASFQAALAKGLALARSRATCAKRWGRACEGRIDGRDSVGGLASARLWRTTSRRIGPCGRCGAPPGGRR